MTDIYFWRQYYILSTGLLTSLWGGFMIAFPSVLQPAITDANSTDITTTRDHASWIMASNGFGGFVGSFIMAPILQNLGRKACLHTMNFCSLIGFLIYPFAENIAALYAARFIQGLSLGGIYISVFIISEYAHPRRRGYFITLKKVATAVGVLCCHAMSVSLTWRQIAVIGAIPPFLAIIMTHFWPESPSYLALRGKFAECEKSFQWLNRDSEESKKHLKSLIEAQREKIVRNKGKKYSFSDLAKTFLKKDFQKPFLMSSVLTLSMDLLGKYYYTAYIIQILTELMSNKASATYFTLGADFFTVVAVYASSVVIRYAKRRTVLLSSGIISVLLMFLISLIVYLKSIYSFSAPILWVTASIIILQIFIVNIGFTPFAFALIGEIFPLEHKGLAGFASSIVFTFIYTVILKITPILIDHTELYGTFSIYAVVLAINMVYLYKTVPETKDKTLQQIEDELNDAPSREMIAVEQEKLMS